jgi:excisionase family DNA binding protein
MSSPAHHLPNHGPMQYLTVEEVARFLRVSKMTVYRLVHSRELTSIQIGRSYRIPRAELRAYIDKQVAAA